MKGGVLLADSNSGETADALVGAVERGYKLLFIIMRDVQLKAQAHAVSFHGALPHSFRAGDGIRRFSRAGAGGLAMKHEREAGAALHPSAVDAGVTCGYFPFIGSA